MNKKAVEILLKHLTNSHKNENNLTQEEAEKSANDFFYDDEFKDVAKMIIDAMEDYAKKYSKEQVIKKKKSILRIAKKYKRFENGLDTNGFVYISQLEAGLVAMTANVQAYCEGLMALGVSPKHLLLLGFM